MSVRVVELPAPFPHQQEILASPARVKIPALGRQSGKTLMGARMVLVGHGPIVDGVPTFRGSIHGANVWWVTKDYPTSTKVWRDIKHYLRLWGGELEKSEQERRIEFPGGGSLSIRSASDPDSLRGETLNGVVGDEVGFWHPDALNLGLRPALAVRRGWLVLISTPNGPNFFEEEWRKGRPGDPSHDPSYESWQLPSSVNPALPPGEIEKMRRHLGLYGFNREVLAQFDVAGGGMFQREWFRGYTAERRDGREWLVPKDGSVPAQRADLFVFVTCDFAWSTRTAADFRVYAVWGRSHDGRIWMLHLERGRDLEGFTAPTLVPRLCRIVERWSARAVFIEASGPLVRLNAEAKSVLPGIVYEDAIHAGTEKKDKVSRAQQAAAAVESGRVVFPEGAPWLNAFVSECCNFPDSQQHDDQVDCLTLAVRFSPPNPPPTGPPARTPVAPPGDSGFAMWDTGAGDSWDVTPW